MVHPSLKQHVTIKFIDINYNWHIYSTCTRHLWNSCSVGVLHLDVDAIDPPGRQLPFGEPGKCRVEKPEIAASGALHKSSRVLANFHACVLTPAGDKISLDNLKRSTSAVAVAVAAHARG